MQERLPFTYAAGIQQLETLKNEKKFISLSRWVHSNVNTVFYQWIISAIHMPGCNGDKKHGLSTPIFILFLVLFNWVWKNWGVREISLGKTSSETKSQLFLSNWRNVIKRGCLYFDSPKGSLFFWLIDICHDFLLRRLDSEEHRSCFSTFK